MRRYYKAKKRTDAPSDGATAPPAKRARRSSKKRVPFVSNRAMIRRQTARLLRYPLAVNPFPPVLKTTFTYPQTTALLAPGAASGVTLFALNSLFDFDFNNNFGNVQPLYYDTLITATGPYKSYRVTGWRVKFTIDNFTQFSTANAVGLDVAVCQGALTSGEIDSWSEMASSPNLQRRLLQWYGGGSCARCVLEINGKPEDFVTKDIKDADLAGAIASSPAQVIYGGVGIANPNLVGNNVSAYIMVHAEMDAELYSDDGIAS